MNALARIAPLVAIGNVADYGAVRDISHDSDYVQVRIADIYGNLATYTRRIRQRTGVIDATGYSKAMAAQVTEVAGLVGTPALVAWLLDSGFVLSI